MKQKPPSFSRRYRPPILGTTWFAFTSFFILSAASNIPRPDVKLTMVGIDPLYTNSFLSNVPERKLTIFTPNSAINFEIKDEAVQCSPSLSIATVQNFEHYRALASSANSFAEQDDGITKLGSTQFNIKENGGIGTLNDPNVIAIRDFFNQSDGSTAIFVRSVCVTHSVSLVPFRGINFTPGFSLMIEFLSQASQDQNSETRKDGFRKFVQRFGTHFSRSTNYGYSTIFGYLFSEPTNADTEVDFRRQCLLESVREVLTSGTRRECETTSQHFSRVVADMCGVAEKSVVVTGDGRVGSCDLAAKESPRPVAYSLAKISALFDERFTNQLMLGYALSAINTTSLLAYFEEQLGEYSQEVVNEAKMSAIKPYDWKSSLSPDDGLTTERHREFNGRRTSAIDKVVGTSSESRGYPAPNRGWSESRGSLAVNHGSSENMGSSAVNRGLQDSRDFSGLNNVLDSLGHSAVNHGSPGSSGSSSTVNHGSSNARGVGNSVINRATEDSGLNMIPMENGTIIVAGGGSSGTTLSLFGKAPPSLSVNLYAITLSHIGDTLYRCGGQSGAYMKLCYHLKLGGEQKNWQPLTLPWNLKHHSAVVVNDEIWFFLDSKLLILHTRDSTFQFCQVNLEFKFDKMKCAVSYGSKVFLLGAGSDGDLIYMNSDPSRPDQWRRFSFMQHGRYDFGCLVYGSEIFVTGGHSVANKSRLSSTEVVNVLDGSGRIIEHMSGVRASHQMAILNGRPAVIGGHNGSYMNTIETFDQENNVWEIQEETMAEAKAWFGLVQFFP